MGQLGSTPMETSSLVRQGPGRKSRSARLRCDACAGALCLVLTGLAVAQTTTTAPTTTATQPTTPSGATAPAATQPTTTTSQPVADFFVAIDGSDGWSGRLSAPNGDKSDGPFASLDRARSAVRELLGKVDRDIVVLIRGGEYQLDETVLFEPPDSGRGKHKVIYAAYPGERPRLIGARPIRGWQRHDEQLYKASTDPNWTFHQLFADGEPLRLARHPDRGYLYVADAVKDKPRTAFVAKKGDLPDGTDWRGGQVVIWAGHDWFSNLLPIASVDTTSRTITLAGPTLVDIVRKDDRRYFVQGVRGALDRPNEFWRDPKTGEVFYWPFGSVPYRQEILAPTVTRIIAMVGKGPDQPVRNIVLRGLSLAISKFTNEFVETRGTHGKTPWNEPANKEAAVYLEHAEGCGVEFCEIAHAGYSGIAIVWHGQGNRIYGNHIHGCGFHGVLLSGYRSAFGSKMDRNKNNVVSNNWIHHVGRLVGHAAGVFVWASGHNEIAHNLIHNSPRYGVCIKGERWGGKFPKKIGEETVTWENHWDFVHSRKNRIAFNDIFRVAEDSEDNGFISFWGVGKGNVIDHNLLHHSIRTLGGLGMAIYLDDAADHCTVTNNLIYKIEGGSVIRCIFAKGVYNRIENNILVGTERTRSGIASFFMAGERVDHHAYCRNIIYLPNGAPMYEFLNWTANRVVESDYNVFFAGKDGKVRMLGAPGGDDFERWRKLAEGKFDAHSVCGDPMFVDPTRHDYRLRPESPALTLGFRPIQVDKIGLLTDFPRPTERPDKTGRAIVP